MPLDRSGNFILLSFGPQAEKSVEVFAGIGDEPLGSCPEIV
jgi:hypothetical protein